MRRILNSWSSNPLYIRVIRLWLGVTWVYGGWNKASDPGFLDSASPHYIGTQINGYLTTSPLAPLMRRTLEHATQIGWLIMISEFAVGFAILFGVAMELASLAGLFTAITLWLTATWTVKPYFLGSDTAYAILWLALFLYLMQKKRVTAVIPNLTDRRQLLQFGSVAGLSVVAALAGKFFENKNAHPEMGKAIATTSELPVGNHKIFTAADGTPAIVFRTNAGVFAYSRVCTHQGCSVNFDINKKVLLCPCHGAEFDPTSDAKVLTGPAPKPLIKINVAIKGNNIVQI